MIPILSILLQVDIDLGAIGGQVGDAISGFIDNLFTDFLDDLGDIIETIADITYYTPRPEADTPLGILTEPSGIWGSIYTYHFETAVPIALTILITMWFVRKGGVAAGILGSEAGIRSNRNLLAGIVMVMLSYYIVALYLNSVHLIVTAIAPTGADYSNIIGDIGLAGASVASVFIYFNVSVNITIILLVLLVNLLKVLSTFTLAIIAAYAFALHYAGVPIISPTVTKMAKKLAIVPLWSLPVAAGWRVMYELNEADVGLVETFTGSELGGSVDTILSSLIFMIPLVIGIISPLLMTNVSQLYYLNRMAGLQFGRQRGSSGGGGGGGGSGGGGLMDKDVSNMSTEEYQEAYKRNRNPMIRDRLDTAKSYTPGLSDDKEYIDWENVDRTKRLGRGIYDGITTGARALTQTGDSGGFQFGGDAGMGRSGPDPADTDPEPPDWQPDKNIGNNKDYDYGNNDDEALTADQEQALMKDTVVDDGAGPGGEGALGKQTTVDSSSTPSGGSSRRGKDLGDVFDIDSVPEPDVDNTQSSDDSSTEEWVDADGFTDTSVFVADEDGSANSDEVTFDWEGKGSST